MEGIVRSVDHAIVRLMLAVREQAQRPPGSGPDPAHGQAETEALLVAAARLRRAVLACGCGRCRSCRLLPHLDEREVAALLLWTAFQELHVQAGSPGEHARLTLDQLIATRLLEQAAAVSVH